MRRKIVISLVSLILLVGVIVGVIVVVHKNTKNEDDHSNIKMKRVNQFCQAADFKDECVESLDAVSKNDSATLKDYLMASLKITGEEIKKSIEITQKTSVDNHTDPYNHMAVDDCKLLLQYAMEDLQSTQGMIEESKQELLHERVYDMLNLLSAVYSLQTICLDVIDKPEYKNPIEKGLDKAKKLSNNAINIVAKISDTFQSFNIKIPNNLLNDSSDNSSPHRRLLDANKMGDDGYPTWFPIADRKLLANSGKNTQGPHVVVAKDGSGKFNTVSAAIAAYPPKHQGRYIIYVKAGIYNEHVIVDRMKTNLYIYGDGQGKTIITGDQNNGIMKIPITRSAPFGVDSDGFIAKGITFRNTAGPTGEQAVALRIGGDNAVVYDCSIEGYQDTLFYEIKKQFYSNCVISGTIDFIFGKGAAMIQNSLILVRKPKIGQQIVIAADGKETLDQPGGVVFQNCRIAVDKDLYLERLKFESYLARPWKQFSTNIFMENEIGDFIRAEGYLKWETNSKHFHETCEMAEYANRGPGAVTNGRNKLAFKKFHVLSPQEAAQYTLGAPFFQGNEWVPSTGAPFYLGLGGK